MIDAQLRQLTPVIGTEITGLDLNRLDDAMADWLRSTLAERLVLVFRDQHLDREAHKRVARIFGTGELHRHALVRGSGQDEEIAPIKTTPESKFAIGEGWHTDVSCDRAPIAASLLYLTELPQGGGGDTLFSSMIECCQRLSPPLRAFAGTLSALHDGSRPFRDLYGVEPPPDMPYNKTVHPLIVAHPVTGKPVLWVNSGFTTRIEGVSPRESRALLDMFLNHIETCLTAQCRVKWEANTLVMWDNIATQHHAVWDYFPNSRYAERVSVIGPEIAAA